MTGTAGLESERRTSWQGRTWIQVVAAALGVLPLYWTLIVLQLRGSRAVSLRGFTFYLAVIAPLSLVTIALLLRFLCGESPRRLNLRSGKASRDLLAALVLSVVIVVASVTTTGFLSMLMPGSASNPSVRNLFTALAGNPKLLALFLGPLLLLGAASEEVVRTFLLGRLWIVWSTSAGKAAAVVVSAGLFSLVHLYQGPVHAIWTGILGLIMALHYARYGRVVPLVLAHYLTNALQLAVFAVNAA